MKKRIFSLLTALALCLTLLPGTAWAVEGPVTITDNDGNSVTLEAGKYYVVNTSGVTEQNDAPKDNAYLTYDDGTLTVYGKEGESNVNIFGKMALSGDLDVTVDPAAKESVRLNLTWEGDSDPALALNGHTLTLKEDMSVNIQAWEGNKLAVDEGAIRFAKKSDGNQIQLSSTAFNLADAGSAASGDLAVENAWMVYISGKPPVFQRLDVKECDQVMISSYDDTELSDTINKITIDHPTPLRVEGAYVPETGYIKTEGLMMPDHTVWYDGGGFSPSSYSINGVTTPTAYRAGDGWAFYTPGEGGNPAALTLDNAAYDGMLTIASGETHITAKGENWIYFIDSPNAVTVDESGGTLNTTVAVGEEGTAHIMAYGKTELPDELNPVILDGSDYQMTIQLGAELTVSRYNTEDNAVTIQDLARFTNHGTLVNQGEVILSGSLEGGSVGTIVNDGVITLEGDAA